MTSNAGGRNDRPTLPPPFGTTRQAGPGAPPPKSNPSIPLAAPLAGQQGHQQSSPSIPLPTPGSLMSQSSPGIPLPSRAGRQTQQPLPGRSHSSTQPPPLGPPPRSQPFIAAGPPPGGAITPTQSFPPPGPPPHSQPFIAAGPPPGGAMTPAQSFPPLGPPPATQPYAPAGPLPATRSQPISQPPSMRSHSSTQQPLPGRSHSSTQPPPLGPPPMSQPFAPATRSHSSTQPPPLGPPPRSQPFAPATRSHSSSQPPPLGPPPMSQPFAPARSHSSSQPPPLGPPPSQVFSPAAFQQQQGAPTHLGIPAAPQGHSNASWPQPNPPGTPVSPGLAAELSGVAPLSAEAAMMVGPHGFAPPQGAPFAGPPPGAPGAAALLSSHGGLSTSLRRAFRLRIDPAEVLPSEASALEAAGIHDPHHRAFLAWRRSVLLVAALFFVPLTLLRLIGALGGDGVPGHIRALQLLPALAEGGFCALMWMQLSSWTRWQAQRRLLLLGWIACFLAPFAVFLYPIDGAIVTPSGSELAGGSAAAATLALSINSLYALQAFLVLGPKAIALMPGLVRSSIVAKLLFPGSAAPGWLVVMATPIYALIVYLVMVIPYQLSGSGYFVLAMVGILGSLAMLGRVGYRLARPTTHLDAASLVSRARAGYLMALAAGGLFAVVALFRLTSIFGFDALTAINALVSLGANVLVFSLVGADLVISNMENARTVSVDAHAAIAESQQRLSTFARESTPGTNVRS